jgi:hypothetical protein
MGGRVDSTLPRALMFNCPMAYKKIAFSQPACGNADSMKQAYGVSRNTLISRRHRRARRSEVVDIVRRSRCLWCPLPRTALRLRQCRFPAYLRRLCATGYGPETRPESALQRGSQQRSAGAEFLTILLHDDVEQTQRIPTQHRSPLPVQPHPRHCLSFGDHHSPRCHQLVCLMASPITDKISKGEAANAPDPV